MSYSVLDLFCGCGGLSEGFRQSGFKIIGGIDVNESAIKTYHHNFPEANAICTDLMEFNETDILNCFPDLNKIDVIIDTRKRVMIPEISCFLNL